MKKDKAKLLAEAASIMGRKGSKARAAAQTPERRKEVAQQAANARWAAYRAAKEAK